MGSEEAFTPFHQKDTLLAHHHPQVGRQLWFLPEVWDMAGGPSPSRGFQDHCLLPFTESLHVQLCCSTLGPFTRTHCTRGARHVTSRHLFSLCMFLILIPLCPPPCLSLSQCSFPEIEFRQAPGKSEGSTWFKQQLKIFLLDSPPLKQRARVLWMGDKGPPLPPATVLKACFSTAIRKGSLDFKNGFLNNTYGTFFFFFRENSFQMSS